ASVEKKNNALLNEEEFFVKFILKERSVSSQDIEEFIKENNIPEASVNNEMKERVRKYLDDGNRREAVTQWLAEKTKKSPVEIYFKRPKRPWFNMENNQGSSSSLILEGSSNAKVSVVVFVDYQCSFSAKAVRVIKDIRDRYGKKVQLLIQNYPLPFHQYAKEAAMASFCANEQGSEEFEKMFFYLFKKQSELSRELIKGAGESLGLKESMYEECLLQKRFSKELAQSIAFGEKLGIKATPVFFVNGQMIRGVYASDLFFDVINEELSK
ncbi:MAG: DsbA family protein, partial [Oligoflexia bacterium]|nr:DsbA family protein [Oligoflexia bacterium]